MARHVLATLVVASFALLPACDDASDAGVGPEGGVVVSDDGRLTLELPEGALGETVTISVRRIDAGPDVALASYELQPEHTMLARPATLTYDWAADGDDGVAALTLVGKGGGATLAIQSADGWSNLADQKVDLEQTSTQASLLYFAPIAVFALE